MRKKLDTHGRCLLYANVSQAVRVCVAAQENGFGCRRPLHVDEVHLAMDAYALISYPYRVAGLDVTVPAFNLTGLLDSAPKVMLNYQSDDYGIVETRACGCGLQNYGYPTHLHDIRSYSKLVGEGP